MCRTHPSSSYYNLNPQHKLISINSRIDPESAVLCDASNMLSSVYLNNITHGLFNDKHPLHLIPHPKKRNVFINRMSYDALSDSYYENGIFDKKYIEFWDQGALHYENLVYAIHYSDDRTYLRDTMALFPENPNFSASIIYKFDYSSYMNLMISSLNLKLNCYENDTGYHLIISISTDVTSNSLSSTSLSNNLKNLKWNIIKETYIKATNERTNLPKNLTHLVKNNKNKIFYIKAEIIKKRAEYQRNLQLFPYIKNDYDEFAIKNNFGLDVKVELTSISSYNLENSLYSNMDLGKIKYTKLSNMNTLNIGGLFNDKYEFNVLPRKGMKNIYTHRISYNVITNAYYENGKTDVKYLKRWDRGTFAHKNIYYSLEKSEKILSVDKKRHPAYIAWKFDYRPGNFYINSLRLKLKYPCSFDKSKIQWSIQLLPTRKNSDVKFQPIIFPLQENKLPYTSEIKHPPKISNPGLHYEDFGQNCKDPGRNYVQKSDVYFRKDKNNLLCDLTEIVKDEYGFILKAYMSGGKPQLFRQDTDDNFDMDVEVELVPNIICDDLIQENFIINDKSTSDFIIKLSEDNIEEFFYVHSKILSSKSDYFKALFNSQMLESQNRSLRLTDISYDIFEKVLSYIYTGSIENTKNFDDWIDLLYVSSRFLIPKLVQFCELSIRKFVNFDKVEKIKIIARECNAMQLVKYCEMYEI